MENKDNVFKTVGQVAIENVFNNEATKEFIKSFIVEELRRKI
jgi:hypothetical protein